MFIHMYKRFLVVLLLAMPVMMKAQSMGTRADMVNKTWRIVAIKCPDEYRNTSEEDQFVKILPVAEAYTFSWLWRQ